MFRRLALSLCVASCCFAHGKTGAAPCSSPPCTAPLPAFDNYPNITVDFLYWVAKQEGNNYAATGSAITVPGTVDPNTGLTPDAISGAGKVYTPGQTGSPGFKAALGVDLSHDMWDFMVEYAWLYSHQSNSVSSDDLNTGILPLFSYTPNNSVLESTTYATSSGAAGFVSQANSSWSLHFNNINVELGKSIDVTCNFVLHPHFGLQGSLQTQHFTAGYDVSSYTDPATSLGNNEVKFKQTFWGVGPRIGMDGLWQCCDHFGLFANTGFSALWGQFKATATSYDTNVTADYSDVLIADQVYRPSTLSPMMQLSVGAQTDWMVWKTRRLAVHAAWEGQVWFFQNQHSSSIADTNLLLQGLTLGARVDY